VVRPDVSSERNAKNSLGIVAVLVFFRLIRGVRFRRVTGLILKRASASRPSGEWNDDDYDVLAEALLSAASSRPMLRRLARPGCGL
jgi:hypothetical protein